MDFLTAGEIGVLIANPMVLVCFNLNGIAFIESNPLGIIISGKMLIPRLFSTIDENYKYDGNNPLLYLDVSLPQVVNQKAIDFLE
ncbi:hypothetical protein P4J24_22995 [Bacillus anthracis]|uniref:hypothetical protein n=1 Tax=Bacillus TaxID=1386 RepID=UPI001123F9AC|nr:MULTISPECIES: hypothetical protein [Bacillus cereus group]MEB9684733.1 hypothetical protein [Bacillus anthracis]